MATKPKERDLQVKEKRGTSPSFPRPTDSRKSPTPVAAAQKQVPNYLKPTQSTSRLDPSTKPTTKKQSLNDKPNHLTRRKSFDKPPSPSQITKPQTSTTSPNSLRSSSFSAKTNPLQKAQLEKLTKGTKDVGKNSSLQQPRISNVRKSNAGTTTNIKKQNNASSNTTLTKKGIKMTSTQSIVIDSSLSEPEEKYQESLPVEADEIDEKNITTDIHKPEEDKEHIEDVINEEEFDEGKEQLNVCDSSIVTEDHSAPLLANKEEIDQPATDDHTPEEDYGSTNNHQEVEENKKDECFDDTLVGEKHELDGEKKEIIEEVVSVSSKEEVEGNKEVVKCEEIPQVEKVTSKAWKTKDAENSVVKKSQGGPQGKKDTAAYNDVIEETASKLREQRKNKVKALVGAFETVISLESETTSE